ncbi:MAG: hypothetical protein JWN82_606 [Candidatus Saccharibacteria bacterium]|nr:hypothetical protein [Candidatus Saccharibacteria bacterium]
MVLTMSTPEEVTRAEEDNFLQRLDAAINDDYIDSLIVLMYRLDVVDTVNDFYIAETSNGKGDDQEIKAATRIDDLVGALGGNATKWMTMFVGGCFENTSKWPLRPMDALSSDLRGESVGTFLTRRAFDALPIEWQEEGEGLVELSLAVDSDRVLSLRSEGSYELVYPDDEEDGESEVCYDIKFSANIFKVSP